MTSTFISSFSSFFGYAMVAMMVENVIFARSLGVSRLIKTVDDAGVDTVVFCGLLFIIQLITTPLAYFAQPFFLSVGDLRYYIRPLYYATSATFAFFIIYFILYLAFGSRNATDVTGILPMATFNCTIFGTMYFAGTQMQTFNDAMGYTVGSTLGYFLAALVITEGQQHISKKEIPSVLRGLPIMLIYIGMLALAIYGFSGHSVI